MALCNGAEEEMMGDRRFVFVVIEYAMNVFRTRAQVSSNESFTACRPGLLKPSHAGFPPSINYTTSIE